jgi:hypothetical protein
MQQFSQEWPAAHLPRGLQCVAILGQELLMPPLGQQSQDRRRVLRRAAGPRPRSPPAETEIGERGERDPGDDLPDGEAGRERASGDVPFLDVFGPVWLADGQRECPAARAECLGGGAAQ